MALNPAVLSVLLAFVTGVLYPLFFNRASAWLARRDAAPQKQEEQATARITREQARIRELEIQVEEVKRELQIQWDAHRKEIEASGTRSKEAATKEAQLITKYGMLAIHFAGLVDKSETLLRYIHKGQDVNPLIEEMEITLKRVKEFDQSIFKDIRPE